MDEVSRKRLYKDAIITYGNLPTAIDNLKRLREHGIIGFTPPVCGFLTRAGVLMNMQMLDLVIDGLEKEYSDCRRDAK